MPRAAHLSGPRTGSPWSGPTLAPREARCDLQVGDLGERQRPQMSTVLLMCPSREEQAPALAVPLKDPSQTHDRSPATDLRIRRSSPSGRSVRCRPVRSQAG